MRFFEITLATAFILILGSTLCAAKAQVSTVASPPSGTKSVYQGNRSPLLPSPLAKLPIGSIRPEGWLRTQLQLMADGFVGHLTEISPWCKFDGSAWADPKGEGKNGWEELPYWLKGFTDLGYVLGDKRIIAESDKWIDGILSSQRPDGYFGPQSNLDKMDLWPNMCALYALRSHYEATADKRVIPFMTRYCKWMMTVPRDKFLPGSWQKTRGGDNLDNIYWLYNHTAEKWLLDLARVNHEHTADWTGTVASWHGVNFAECFREPAEYYQQTKDIRYLKATERDYDTGIGIYGQVPGGGIGADENCRPGFTGPRQGTETCTWVEFMYSDEMLTAITGDPVWADRCEEVAFNSLPTSMTPDLKGLHYLTAPNQVQLDRQNKSPMIQNGGDMFSYDPRSYRCCQHNVAMGWPYFSEHLWMATGDGGFAAVLYAPCEVTAKTSNGAEVKIVEATGYPFDEAINFSVSPSKDSQFPLYLRIPGWCDEPKVSVNGETLTIPKQPKGWLVIDRSWKKGDKVQLTLTMTPRVKVWEKNRDAVSIYRGPLAYSVKIGERWQKYRETDDWPGFEVFPTTPWNYGLILGPDSLQVVKLRNDIPTQPFTPDDAPIGIRVKAKKIPQWKQESNGMVGAIQKSPILSDEPVEEITLVPMGCCRLRISEFPQIGEGPDAHVWEDQTTVVEASYSNQGDTITAVNDRVVPTSSADRNIPRFTWWDHRGTSEWVSYTFRKPRKIGSVEVYWFDDQPLGGGCRVPASWKASWWDGKAWQPVGNASDYGTKRDTFNRVTFEPVETTRVRIDVQLQSGVSGGILECRVEE